MSHDYVLMGRVTGVYGIKGYVKLQSYAQPKENILNYEFWWLQLGKEKKQTKVTQVKVTQAKMHGQGVIAQLNTVCDRDEAMQYVGADIYIPRQQLPVLAEDECYWNDLIGLAVVNVQGEALGQLVSIQETAAHAVFVVLDRNQGNCRRFIPWVNGIYLEQIDLDAGKIVVHWLKDYDS